MEQRINELKLKNASLTQGLEEAQWQQEQQQQQLHARQSAVAHPLQQQQHDEAVAQKKIYKQAISSAVKEAAAAATNSAADSINMLTADNGNLRAQMSAMETRLREECMAREEAQSALVRREREVKRLGESREREVMLREVAENAVFEAESEIERHRVLYHKEREKRKEERG